MSLMNYREILSPLISADSMVLTDDFPVPVDPITLSIADTLSDED